jgi:hypothetical protein
MLVSPITRTETPTGSEDRTRREEIVPLNTGKQGARGVEPEGYLDCSESEGWPWDNKPSVCTWDIQLPAVRSFIVPFEVLDAQAKEEQAGGDDEKGGVYFYPFSNIFLPIGDGDDDGDLNSANFEEKMEAFVRKYFTADRKPRGGTEIMTAVRAGDEHFMGEFGPGGENEKPRDQRPVRARVVFTDGALNDAKAFKRYLEDAKLDPETKYGKHGEWDEVWAIAIVGPQSGGGKGAYTQYQELAQDHPWIHSYLFADVVNPEEIAEDVAYAVAPAQQDA